MNLKKAMVIILAAGMIGASFAACSQDTNNEVQEAAATSTTVAAEEQSKETTQPQTEIVSQVVTDKNGETTVVTQVVTKKTDSTKAAYSNKAQATDSAKSGKNVSATKSTKNSTSSSSGNANKANAKGKKSANATTAKSGATATTKALANGENAAAKAGGNETTKTVAQVSNANTTKSANNSSNGKETTKSAVKSSDSKETTKSVTKTPSGNETAKSVTKASANNEEAKSTTKASGGNETTKATTTTKPSTTKEPETSEAKETVITLQSNGKASCQSEKVSVNSSGYGTVTINSPGDYIIKSDVDVWHGQIIVKLKNTENADIRLENVNIATQNANAIQIIDTSIENNRSFIEADVSSGTAGAGDTDNTLQDAMKEVAKQPKAPNVSLSFPTGTSSSFSTVSNNISGVLYNESKLTIKGNGKVTFESKKNRNNAIASTKSVSFKNVDATLITPANESTSALSCARGIFCYSKVNVESGSLTIKSNGDGIRCEEFNSADGTTNIKSSASDGVDADDAIIITGGKVTVEALQKSCLKVRRVNNQEKLNEGKTSVKADDGVNKPDHTFKIDGGTVVAMGKNITTLKSVKSNQTTSNQASIVCKSVKAKGSEEAKKAIAFSIKGSGVNVSSGTKCIKYLYSSSSIDSSKEYTVSSSGYSSEKVAFTGKAGVAKITATV